MRWGSRVTRAPGARAIVRRQLRRCLPSAGAIERQPGRRAAITTFGQRCPLALRKLAPGNGPGEAALQPRFPVRDAPRVSLWLAGHGAEALDRGALRDSGLWLLVLGFLAPLLTLVAAYAFATPRGFDLVAGFTLANFATILITPGLDLIRLVAVPRSDDGHAIAVIAYPIAYGLNRMFGKWSGFTACSLRLSSVCFGKRSPLWVGAVLHQEWCARGTLKRLPSWRTGPTLHARHDALWHGLRVLTLHAFPHIAPAIDGPKDLVDVARDLGAGAADDLA